VVIHVFDVYHEGVMSCPILLRTLVISLIAALFLPGQKEPYGPVAQRTVRQWGAAEGLPTTLIHRLAQDGDGFFWLASDQGLYRFDGHRFSRIFPNTPQAKPVETVFVDSRDAVWFFCQEGVFRHRDGDIERMIDARSWNTRSITGISEDIHGGLWFATANDFVLGFRNGACTPYGIAMGTPSPKITGLLCDHGGGLWVSVLDQGLYQLMSHAFRKANLIGLPQDLSVYSLYEDHDQGLWISTTQGLYVHKGGHTQRYTLQDGLQTYGIHSMTQDQGGTLWLGTDTGLSTLSQGHDGTATFTHAFEDGTVTQVLVDLENSVWVVLKDRGLVQLIEQAGHTLTPPPACSHHVTALCLDSKGTLWTGTTSGLLTFRDGTFTELETAAGLGPMAGKPSLIRGIQEGRDHVMWIATASNGLIRIEQGRQTLVTSRQGLSDDRINTLLRDTRGRIWIGSASGLDRITGKSITPVPLESASPPGGVLSLFEDSSKNLWAATGTGLLRIRTTEANGFSISRHLEGIPVQNLMEDTGRRIWFTTRGQGMGYMDQSHTARFLPQKHLFTRSLYAIHEDGFSFLWFSSPQGIYRVYQQDLLDFEAGRIADVPYMLFNRNQGMPSEKCSEESRQTLLAHGDLLLFATHRGIFCIRPQTILVSPVRTPGLFLDILPSEDPSPHQGLRFYLSCPTYLANAALRFSYQLLPLDTDRHMIPPGRPRTVAYPDLKPGNYTLMVNVQDANGLWRQAAKPFAMSVSNPFKDFMLWFLTGLLAVLATLVLVALSRKRRHPPPPTAPGPTPPREPANREQTTALRIRNLLERERHHLNPDLSLSTFAALLNMPPHQVSRILSETMNTSFSELINRYRVEEAKRRLTDPRCAQLRIITIGLEAGFNSKASFNRLFKDMTGTTPSQYRKEHTR